jgi:hypothetical protein
MLLVEAERGLIKAVKRYRGNLKGEPKELLQQSVASGRGLQG